MTDIIEHFFDDDLIVDQTSWTSQGNEGGLHAGVSFCVGNVQVSIDLEEIKKVAKLLEHEIETSKPIFEGSD